LGGAEADRLFRLKDFGAIKFLSLDNDGLTAMLKKVVEQGTARSINKLDRIFAGKTGTSNDFMDAWFMGFTRYRCYWCGTHSNSLVILIKK